MFKPVITSVPDEVEVEASAGGFAVTIPLTATEDGLQKVAVQVRLDPTHWLGHPIHTFGFAIVTFNAETGETKEIYDRFAASGYLGDTRRLVVPIVQKSAGALIRFVRPAAIHRVTFVTAPHEKALHKHQMITDTIEKLGYRVAKWGTDLHGRQFWIMVQVKEG